MSTSPLVTPNKSHYKPKHTDCFNDLAFIKLFSHLRLDAERSSLNEPNSMLNPSPSSQTGLATPPEHLPEIIDHSGSSSTVVSEGNIVLRDSTIQASSDKPTSRANCRKKNKFYVVTRGRRTGVFANWSIVQPLVNRIPGNCHISFDTHEMALEVYEAAKRRGDLRVIWITAEDEITYGPKEDAMM